MCVSYNISSNSLVTHSWIILPDSTVAMQIYKVESPANNDNPLMLIYVNLY